jgi:DNA modification methylase
VSNYVVHIGDALDVLPTLDAGSVNCCVTSPPYWGLRDYGTAKWEGGDPECSHVGTVSRTVSGGDGKQYTNEGSNRVYSGDCSCGARRIDSQLGLEPTPEEYVAKIVAVFREVRRVLRDDGTLWLNLGDSYAAQRGGTMMPAETLAGGVGGKGDARAHRGRANSCNGGRQDETSPEFRSGPVAHRNAAAFGLKHKDLVGIPWRVAFALQADGWYLRSDIIWSKPNPMPESVTDRPTKAHEYVFLLSKAAAYYYDADAISEQSIHAGRLVRYDGSQKNCSAGDSVNDWATLIASDRTVTPTRNRRTVWHIATQPFPEAHFATYPEKLVEPCVLAGCPVGGTVLDPFTGSGTTGVVACRLGRDFIGIELNPEYAAMAERRIAPFANQMMLDFCV